MAGKVGPRRPGRAKGDNVQLLITTSIAVGVLSVGGVIGWSVWTLSPTAPAAAALPPAANPPPAPKPRNAPVGVNRPAAPSRSSDADAAQPDPATAVSPAERAVLERLQARRQEIETRAREIDIRESLVKTAEQKLEGKLQELKATEARITAVESQKAKAEAARLKDLVTMYENMKPKDAAKVFDRLDIAVLYQIASQIAPRKLSDIVGQMQPENAERLTVEIARRAGGEKSASLSDLPKIEGRPVN